MTTRIDAALEGALATVLLYTTTMLALVLGSACGGETTGTAISSPTTSCRDEAHREADVDLVVCSEHARIEREDGWIVCRCTPAPSTGGTP